ncbi:MAG: TonB-dependent siderophore receptor, partial [Methylocystaceae bacterium]
MGSTVATLALGAFAMAAETPDPARASISPRERVGLLKTYAIPAGPMASALNAFALENGLHLLYDARVTRAMQTSGLSGAYTLRKGLDRLLSGTGLTYSFGGPGGAVSIVLAQAGGNLSDAAPRRAEELPPIDIGSGDLAGRHPQTGAPQGKGDRVTGYNAAAAPTTLKTDTPLLKTPVSVGVVTRETMDDQQAISVGDALLSNVSGVTPTPNLLDIFKIRGFSAQSSTYKNGLIELRQRNLDTTNLQSVEVLKGPAAMLFGRSEPGGIINLVVKRPLETPYYS